MNSSSRSRPSEVEASTLSLESLSMHRRHPSLLIVIAVLALSCDSENAARAIDFAKEVAPILETRCVRCHSTGKAKGGLSLSTKSGFLKGGDRGAVVIAGKSDESPLITAVSGRKPEMPAEGTPLTAREVAVLREWITAGAVLPETLSFSERGGGRGRLVGGAARAAAGCSCG